MNYSRAIKLLYRVENKIINLALGNVFLGLFVITVELRGLIGQNLGVLDEAVDNMPTFTVLIPHYSEKILLSLREIIREDEPYSRVTLLEYLKQLHPHEWDCLTGRGSGMGVESDWAKNEMRRSASLP
jgi:hypothetical protein